MSSWVFPDMQAVHIRMNSSLSPPLKKILDPPMTWPKLIDREPKGFKLYGKATNF